MGARQCHCLPECVRGRRHVSALLNWVCTRSIASFVAGTQTLKRKWKWKRSAYPALTALSVFASQVCVWQDQPGLCSQDQHNAHRQAELHLLEPEALGLGLCVLEDSWRIKGEQWAAICCQPRVRIPQTGSHPLTTNAHVPVLVTLHPVNARDCTARQLAPHSFTGGGGRAAHRTLSLPAMLAHRTPFLAHPTFGP